MRLLTVGDSFTYGDELSVRSNAWPFLLSKIIKYDLSNLAKPGSGNTNIVRQCVEQVDNYDMVVIAWSHFARIEFADDFGVYDTWPGNRGVAFTGQLEFRKNLMTYITNYFNDDYLYNQQLINIILLQNYLKINNKKYIMLDAFNNKTFLRDKFHYNELANQIDKEFYLGWPYQSMMEWTYGCAQGPGGHFLEEGHQRVADKIYEHIRHLGWVS
jgi:hypothetical protein